MFVFQVALVVKKLLFILISWLILQINCCDFPDIMKESTNRGACASIAMGATFWCSMEKSRKQLAESEKITKFSVAIRGGLFAMLSIFGAVSIQFFFQNLGERITCNHYPYYAPYLGCLSGALFAAPLYDVINRQSMGQKFRPALQEFICNPYTVLPIVLRDFCFLGSLRFSQPIANNIEEKFGSSRLLTICSHFFVGFFGSWVSYSCDSILNFMQKGKHIPWQNPKILMRGSLTEAFGVGLSNVFYQYLLGERYKLKNSNTSFTLVNP